MSARTGPRSQARPQSEKIRALREQVDQLARLAHTSVLELGRRHDALIARVTKLEQALVVAHEASARKNGGLVVVP